MRAPLLLSQHGESQQMLQSLKQHRHFFWSSTFYIRVGSHAFFFQFEFMSAFQSQPRRALTLLSDPLAISALGESRLAIDVAVP